MQRTQFCAVQGRIEQQTESYTEVQEISANFDAELRKMCSLLNNTAVGAVK